MPGAMLRARRLSSGWTDAQMFLGMGLAPIRFPENAVSGLIALPEPDGGKPHPY